METGICKFYQKKSFVLEKKLNIFAGLMILWFFCYTRSSSLYIGKFCIRKQNMYLGIDQCFFEKDKWDLYYYETLFAFFFAEPLYLWNQIKEARKPN